MEKREGDFEREAGLSDAGLADLALTDYPRFKLRLADVVASGSSIAHRLELLFRSPDLQVRLNAIDAVAQLGATDACGPLAGVLDDSEELVRNAAVETMGIVGCSGENLLAGTADERSPLVLASLAEAIGNLRYEAGLPRLRGLVRHEDEAVRGYAVSSLGILRADEDIDFLKSLALTERSQRVLAPLHVASYAFDAAFADAVLADLRSDDYELVGLALRELTYLAEERPPRWLRDDVDRFMAAVRSEHVAGELASFVDVAASL